MTSLKMWEVALECKRECIAKRHVFKSKHSQAKRKKTWSTYQKKLSVKQ